jgi:hypothetical protein
MPDVTSGSRNEDGNEEQHAELLPARTVLSLLSMVHLDTDGVADDPGTPGKSVPGLAGWPPLDYQSAGVDGAP